MLELLEREAGRKGRRFSVPVEERAMLRNAGVEEAALVVLSVARLSSGAAAAEASSGSSWSW